MVLQRKGIQYREGTGGFEDVRGGNQKGEDRGVQKRKLNQRAISKKEIEGIQTLLGKQSDKYIIIGMSWAKGRYIDIY